MRNLKDITRLWKPRAGSSSSLPTEQEEHGTNDPASTGKRSGATSPESSAFVSEAELALSPLYGIKPGYRARKAPEYFHDNLADTRNIVHQPDVYPFAAFLARRWGCARIVDIGCGSAQKLAPLHPEFELIGVDFGANIALCRARYPFGAWIEHDFEGTEPIPIDPALTRNAVVVCADVIEHMIDPTRLLAHLRALMDHAPVALLTTPERDLLRGTDDMGPPLNPHHVREWNQEELAELVRAEGLHIAFQGLTINNNQKWEKKTNLVIIERDSRAHSAPVKRDGGAYTAPFEHNGGAQLAPIEPDDGRVTPPAVISEAARPVAMPDDFRVVAIMTAYNEEDILAPTVERLRGQGIGVYLIDNWSSDRTREIAESLLGNGLIGLERFPETGPSDTYDWKQILTRVEEVALELDADWFIHHDADDIRKSPWPELTLREGLWRVDEEGFNAVDHTVLDFMPTDNGFVPGTDPEAHLHYFEFGKRPGHFVRIQAWKKQPGRVGVAVVGGHDIQFEGRRVYPYKFLLKHYPIRSQSHGEKKVLRERKARWNAQERAQGWHIHYDQVTEATQFVRDPATLIRFDEATFYRTYLTERLSGVGVPREGSESRA